MDFAKALNHAEVMAVLAAAADAPEPPAEDARRPALRCAATLGRREASFFSLSDQFPDMTNHELAMAMSLEDAGKLALRLEALREERRQEILRLEEEAAAALAAEEEAARVAQEQEEANERRRSRRGSKDGRSASKESVASGGSMRRMSSKELASAGCIHAFPGSSLELKPLRY